MSYKARALPIHKHLWRVISRGLLALLEGRQLGKLEVLQAWEQTGKVYLYVDSQPWASLLISSEP